VPGLFGIIGAKLPDNHDAAKHEKTQEKQNEFVLPHKTHAGFLRGSGASAQLN
jgi:ethanolamine utilization microcompartment shell protein EutL